MQNYRADPVGPAGARGVPRGTEGRTSEGHDGEEGRGEGEREGRDKRVRQHLNPPQLRV